MAAVVKALRGQRRTLNGRFARKHEQRRFAAQGVLLSAGAILMFTVTSVPVSLRRRAATTRRRVRGGRRSRSAPPAQIEEMLDARIAELGPAAGRRPPQAPLCCARRSRRAAASQQAAPGTDVTVNISIAPALKSTPEQRSAVVRCLRANRPFRVAAGREALDHRRHRHPDSLVRRRLHDSGPGSRQRS